MAHSLAASMGEDERDEESICESVSRNINCCVSRLSKSGIGPKQDDRAAIAAPDAIKYIGKMYMTAVNVSNATRKATSNTRPVKNTVVEI